MNHSTASQVIGLVQDGLTPEEIVKTMIEKTNQGQNKTEEAEEIPEGVQIIAQALAYRTPDSRTDFDEIKRLLNDAYRAEVYGGSSFREPPALSEATLHDLFNNDPKSEYHWLVVEAPNAHGIEKD